MVKLINYIPHDLIDLIKIIRISTHTEPNQRDPIILKEVFDNSQSPLEHVVYTFKIDNISRLCLQELVRHRIASYTVRSTRFTLKKDNLEYIKSKNPIVKAKQDEILKTINNAYQELVALNIRNDDLKYILPECLKTELYMTINARSLKNFFELRLSKKAHYEIRNLALEMFKVVYNVHPDLWMYFNYKE